MIFEFPAAQSYAGGAVSWPLPEAGAKLPLRALDDRQSLAYRRFEYMNAFLGALYSAISTVQRTGTQVQEPAHPTNFFRACRDGETYAIFQNGPELDPVSNRNPLLTGTLTHTVELMARCTKVFGEQALLLLSLVYLACHQYRQHQFASAHLIAWGVIEKQINHMWDALLNELDQGNGGHTAIGAQRRKTLRSGREYTASVLSQMLSLHGKIDDELLQRLDAARRRRNEFAHTLSAVSSDDVGKAIRTATELMTRLVGVRIDSQLGMSFFL